MSFKELKKTHPQKYYLKLICTILFFIGGGNCWYHKRPKSKSSRLLYKIYMYCINTFVVVVFIDQVLSSFRPLTIKEQNDVIQFDIAHTAIITKSFVFMIQTHRIIPLLERFLEDDREFANVELERAFTKRAQWYYLAMAGTVYFTLTFTFLDGVRTHLAEGIPVRMEVWYYPSPDHSGVLINILRFFMELHWWYIVCMMNSIDALCVTFMVYLSSKYRLLATYFEGLQTKFLKNKDNKTEEELINDYKDDFIAGIKMHQHALWYAEHIQYALGNMYSIQVTEVMVLLVICLIKLVVLERTLLFLMANLTYMICIVFLVGGYMIAAGEVTYEASLLPNAIFNSGWELTKGRKDIRTLVVVTLTRSQRPVVMTAFGILMLSYSNLISVIRNSYSFFTVMY